MLSLRRGAMVSKMNFSMGFVDERHVLGESGHYSWKASALIWSVADIW